MNNIDHQTDYDLTNSEMASPSQSSPMGAGATSASGQQSKPTTGSETTTQVRNKEENNCLSDMIS
jgi:hypothetical protein